MSQILIVISWKNYTVESLSLYFMAIDNQCAVHLSSSTALSERNIRSFIWVVFPFQKYLCPKTEPPACACIFVTLWSSPECVLFKKWECIGAILHPSVRRSCLNHLYLRSASDQSHDGSTLPLRPHFPLTNEQRCCWSGQRENWRIYLVIPKKDNQK